MGASQRTGGQLLPGQVFEVAQIVDGQDGVQRYLLLSNGSGWGFTHSMKDGRLLAEEISEEEAKMSAPMAGGPGGMHAMMQELESMMARDPEMRQKLMNDPSFLQMLQDPQAMAQMFGQQSPAVGQAMAARPNVANAVNADPEAFANDLAQAMGR